MKKVFKLDRIIDITKQILEKVKKNKSKKAIVLAFYGDLGVGKTTLTKEIGKKLGVKENIVSPTFVIMKKYKTNDNKFKKLIHIDAYRLTKEKELLILGWEKLLENKNNLIIVEWPENVFKYIPKDACRIKLEHKDKETRTIEFCYN